MSATPTTTDSPHARTALVLASVAAVIWVSHYWLSRSFGLYEDDYWWPVQSMLLDWDGFLATLRVMVQNLNQNMARPILDTLMFSLSMLGIRLGGIWGLYLVGYVILFLNGALMYGLALKLTNRQSFAATAALAFVLFPADTSQAFIIHSFGLQTSLTFLLLALNLYARGYRWASYMVASACLLTYEVAYPAFFGAPFLTERWDRRLPRKAFKHFAIAGSILGGVVLWRVLLGESRVASIEPLDTLRHALFNMVVGPFVVAKQWLARPADGLWRQSAEYPLLLTGTFVGSVLLLLGLTRGRQPSASDPERRRRIRDLALGSLVMLPLAYPLALTVEATEVYGRASRVHLAAGIGAAVLVAGALIWLYDVLRSRGKGLAGILIIALVMTAATADGLTIQTDYRDAWQYQRAFWTDVARLCPDAGNNTVVLVDRTLIREPREIFMLGWSMVDVLTRMYAFPDRWELPPVSATLKWNWREQLREGKPLRDCIDWKGMGTMFAKPYADAEYIFLDVVDGKLRRLTGEVELEGRRFHFKERTGHVLPHMPEGPLHGDLLLPPGEPPADYTW